MYFIILATAATLHVAGQTWIESAADAAEALRPLAGDAAALLLTLGLVGSGFLAVPILTGANGYAVCEAMGWRFGLDRKPAEAKRFYGIIALSTLAGTLINFLGFNPVAALFWTAVVNGFLAPPLLVIIMLIANKPEVMGQRTNGLALNVLGWTATALMGAAAVGLVVTSCPF
jgi:Mn2+/Fe2+ NRAMP family transporter